MEKVKSSFIRKRNNKYYVYVEYEDELGRKKQKSQGSFENKKDADKLLIEIKNDINKEMFSVPKSITFVDRCYKYYEDKKGEYAETTLYSSANIIRHRIEPYWKSTPLSEITVSKYQDFVNYIYGDKNIEKNTKKRIKDICNAVLRECHRRMEIKIKITDFIRTPKVIDPDIIDIYGIDEIKYILEESKNYNKTFEIILNLYIFGGMRIGEICGLTWDDVDFDNNRILIRNNLVYTKKDGKMKFVMRTTKTQSGIREIALPKHVINILKNEKVRQNILKLKGLKKKKEYDTVCLSTSNTYYNPSSFRRSYKAFIEKIGLDYKKPHALRHSHVSMLVNSNVDIKTIQHRIGHANIGTTLNTYSHVFKETDINASAKVEDLLL